MGTLERMTVMVLGVLAIIFTMLLAVVMLAICIAKDLFLQRKRMTKAIDRSDNDRPRGRACNYSD